MGRTQWDGLGGALRQVEEKLSTLPEDPPQEAGHGEHDVGEEVTSVPA
jgi:hypothetical protein